MAKPSWWTMSPARISGLRHKVFFINGDQYIGEWTNNVMQGKGTYTWKSSGDVYDGDWIEGLRCGHGVLSVVQNGKRSRQYIGQWMNNQRHGFGMQVYSDKGSYEGEWVSDQRHGRGRMVYEDGSTYEGAWERDFRNGHGTLRCPNGNVYNGGWRNDLKDGAGSYCFADQRLLLEGMWIEGTPSHGVITKVTNIHTKG